MLETHNILSVEESVKTADGWTLPLQRLRGQGPLEKGLPPILCVHGHASTAWIFSGGPRHGLAGALARTGRDLWILGLRGSPGSQAPKRRRPIRVQDKLRQDLPSAIATIRERTRSEYVDAIGHSLGGVMLYLTAGTPAGRRIRRAVTLSSPLTMPRPNVALRTAMRLGYGPIGQVGRVPLAWPLRQLAGHVPRSLLRGQLDPGDVDKNTLRAFLRHGIGDTHGTELVELGRWLQHEDASQLSALHESPLGPLPFPTLFMVGAADPLTPADYVRDTYKTLGCPQSALRVLGRREGFSADYRHGDVLLGPAVRHEIAPLVSAWLVKGADDAQVRWHENQRLSA